MKNLIVSILEDYFNGLKYRVLQVGLSKSAVSIANAARITHVLYAVRCLFEEKLSEF